MTIRKLVIFFFKFNFLKSNWVFATSSDFLITLSFQLNVVRYLKFLYQKISIKIIKSHTFDWNIA